MRYLLPRRVNLRDLSSGRRPSLLSRVPLLSLKYDVMVLLIHPSSKNFSSNCHFIHSCSLFYFVLQVRLLSRHVQ